LWQAWQLLATVSPRADTASGRRVAAERAAGVRSDSATNEAATSTTIHSRAPQPRYTRFIAAAGQVGERVEA
jgi:hypothetical protein